MKHPLKIVFILYFVSLSIVLSQNINDSTKTTGFDYVEIKYPEGRIELFGVKFKDPLVLCQILIGLIMAITFIQSGFDKIINREENLEFFRSQFSKTPLNRVAPLSLSAITVLELIGGLSCAYGIYFAVTFKDTEWIFNGLLILSLTVIILFTGQRIAKDYSGAANLLVYFIVIMLGIMSMY
tara:strand:+ start:66923 stop:67468 length:546 start_codon:yes stop_codon:yes gene_type:complete